MLAIITRGALNERKTGFWNFAHIVGLSHGRKFRLWKDRQCVALTIKILPEEADFDTQPIAKAVFGNEGIFVFFNSSYRRIAYTEFPWSISTEEGALRLAEALERLGAL